MIRRSPSLFVTFALTFFALLLVTMVLQWWFFSDFIDPLIVGWERNKVELTTVAAGEELTARLDELDDDGILELLTRHGKATEGLIIAYLRDEGGPLSNHPLHPRMAGMLGRRGHRFLGPEADGPLPFGRPFQGGRGREERREIFSRYDVSRDGEWAGQLVAVLPPGLIRASTSRHNPRRLLLFLPLALLLAGLAGLVVFRLLTRRLQALEDQTGRVSRGDLSARVGDLGRDEIGRLGLSLDAMTESLARAKAMIADSDRQRRQLLADISHDLATPLTSIRGYTETLLSPDVPLSPGEQSRYLEHVGDESRRMGLLIDDLLELSRLEAGSMPLQPERLDLASLCRNTVDRYRERFEKAGLGLLDRGLAADCWIDADGRRIEQVMDNLLANTLRHVPGGGEVEVALAVSPEGRARLSVADDGPGFLETDLPHIFERFYRADGARSGEGSGLGLAIVREIVVQHGGEICAANRDGGGAVISIEFAAAATRV
jgi:two-component system OmpR family sensor kinase